MKTRRPGQPFIGPSCARSRLFCRHRCGAPGTRRDRSVYAGGGKRAVLGLERRASTAANASSASVERRVVVRGHDARAQQRAARGHGGVHGDVDVDAGVVERLPQQPGLPVVLDEDGHDRRRLIRPQRRHDLEAERAQPVAQVAPRCRARGRRARGPSSERQIRTAASAAPTAAGTAAAVKRKERDWTRRKSMTSAGPAMTPPQEASDFEKVAIRRSTRSSTPSSSEAPAPRAPSTPSAVGLVDHQARAVARGTARRSPAAARRRPPSRRRRRRRRGRRRRRPRRARARARACRGGCGGRGGAWPGRAGSRRGSRRGRRSRRSTVSPGPRIVPRQPRLAWWPVVKTIARLGAEPVGQLAPRARGGGRSCR